MDVLLHRAAAAAAEKLETNDQLLVLLLVAMLAVCGISYTYFHEYYLYFWLMNMPVAIASWRWS